MSVFASIALPTVTSFLLFFMFMLMDAYVVVVSLGAYMLLLLYRWAFVHSLVSSDRSSLRDDALR